MSDILMRPIIAMQVAVHQLREREDGQTTTEYAILLGFLAIAIIVALFFLRDVLAASSRTRPAPFPTHRARPGQDPPSRSDCGECAPARLPPRPGRRIRLSVGLWNEPF